MELFSIRIQRTFQLVSTYQNILKLKLFDILILKYYNIKILTRTGMEL